MSWLYLFLTTIIGVTECQTLVSYSECPMVDELLRKTFEEKTKLEIEISNLRGHVEHLHRDLAHLEKLFMSILIQSKCRPFTFGLMCEPCRCNKITTEFCDYETGSCKCKPGFEGERCNCVQGKHQCNLTSSYCSSYLFDGSPACFCKDGFRTSSGCKGCDLQMLQMCMKDMKEVKNVHIIFHTNVDKYCTAYQCSQPIIEKCQEDPIQGIRMDKEFYEKTNEIIDLLCIQERQVLKQEETCFNKPDVAVDAIKCWKYLRMIENDASDAVLCGRMSQFEECFDVKIQDPCGADAVRVATRVAMSMMRIMKDAKDLICP